MPVQRDADTAFVRFRARRLACLAALVLVGAATAVSASAIAARSVGSPSQIAWVRSAASRFVAAELAGDGATACAILNRPLRATVHGRTCAQRWDARLATLRGRRGARAALHRQARAINHATVMVRGNTAEIELPTPLFKGPNRFLWTENCWMLES
jgi:hypothetical protein